MKTTVTNREYSIVADSSEMSVMREALRMYYFEMKKCGYTELENKANKIMVDMMPSGVIE